MSRPLRIAQPDCLYHVTSRGVRQTDIVRDDEDRLAFVELLARVVMEKQWTLHAWVLMTNHFHLTVTTPLANLSAGMRELLRPFALRFNRVHGYVGHVFQHRFDAKLVERDTHLLELIRYVPLNPVRCGMVRSPADYPWSSYRATAGFEPAPSWLESKWILAQFHPTDRRVAEMRFREFVSTARDVEYDPHAEAAGGWIIGSLRFRQQVQQWIDASPRSEEQPQRRRLVYADFDALMALVKSELDTSDRDLRCRARGPARKLIADLAHEECGKTLREIGLRLSTSTAAAAKLRAHSRELTLRDSEYAGLRAKLRDELRETNDFGAKLNFQT